MEFFSTSSKQSNLEVMKEVQEDFRLKRTPAVRAVSAIIAAATEKRASDIRIEPQAEDIVVRIRVDGVLRDLQRLPRTMQNSLTSRIKIIADMDITERRAPQDGRIMVQIGAKRVHAPHAVWRKGGTETARPQCHAPRIRRPGSSRSILAARCATACPASALAWSLCRFLLKPFAPSKKKSASSRTLLGSEILAAWQARVAARPPKQGVSSPQLRRQSGNFPVAAGATAWRSGARRSELYSRLRSKRMATPPRTPSPQSATGAPPTPAPSAAQAIPTPAIISAMMKSKGVSDVIFSPGRAPQVELSGQLVEVKIAGLPALSPEDTRRIAADLIGRNEHAVRKLEQEGAADLSYSVPGLSRFRVNIFRQRGTYAIVMRVIPTTIPDFATLRLPAQLGEIANLRNGIVLVTGPTGSGKSSTLAAILNKINEEKAYHILTIEDPVEFLHNHKKSTIHQRELHSDTPTFALALRAALRQAPKVILVGEMRDRETIEIALEAAETGHLVFSTLHTIDASKTVERIIGGFPIGDQQAIRSRLAKAFRFIISQRLLPRKDGNGRVAAIEILKSTMRTREYIEKGEGEGKTLVDAMRDGSTEGMQHFDGELEKLLRAGTIDLETCLAFATNPGNLRLELADVIEQKAEDPAPASVEKPAGQSELEIVR